MSSVTLSLILPWLRSSCGCDTVISSNAGSWLNRLSSSGRSWLMEGLSSQGSWTDITLTLGARAGKQQQRKMYRFGQVAPSEKANCRKKNDIHGEKAFTVMKAGDDILNNICHSWHSTRWLHFLCIPFCQICPLTEVKVEWKSGSLFVSVKKKESLWKHVYRHVLFIY